ncbi:unnamed protein product [Parnassius mnemosyne]|uniref:Reverse transcriptase domain-containing protein n=1 Tax=Parnassius mnemosyne TaxID=213953 RepID=A0AAV1KU94_9NEOP
MSVRQCGFVAQRGAKDALYDAIEIVKQGLKRKEIVVVISIDIEGAFDNAWWPGMINELENKKVDRSLCRLISSYLLDREIKLTYAGHELNPLLTEVEGLGTYIQAYADDITIIAKEKSAKDLEKELNPVLYHIINWAKKRKMKLAAQKTQAILITKKMKFENPKIVMGETEISFSDTITILGLTIDADLNFLKHVDRVTEKAIQLYKKVAKTARTNWGLNPEILRTIYITVVEPTILYAASVWGHVANKKQIKTWLDRITRTFSILICKAHRTSSLISCATLARVLPLDLRAQENADLFRIKRGEPLERLPGRELAKSVSPYSLPHPAKRVNQTYNLINAEADLESIGND